MVLGTRPRDILRNGPKTVWSSNTYKIEVDSSALLLAYKEVPLLEACTDSGNGEGLVCKGYVRGRHGGPDLICAWFTHVLCFLSLLFLRSCDKLNVSQ